MSHPTALYRPSLSLLTDLYELTMAQGYWKLGLGDREAAFCLFFREPPFGSGYAVACGLAWAADWIENLRFTDEDLGYLGELTGSDGRALFDPGFLDHLRRLEGACDVDAVPEGTVVFGREPLVRVTGPVVGAQLLESALLNIVNFQTLIATKSVRVCRAARGEPVLEFGLRRAQGIDGSLAAARAAYVGGCAATSNVLAGRLFGIPVKGTHAHSWVMLFGDELEAFDAYARAMPNNCVFLVDTYDSLAGVRRAIEVGRRLRERGHEMVGIRLDSGDLAYLSVEARRMLDEAGFDDAAIVASNELDEHVIDSLKQQGAAVGIWGVGTKLVTGGDDAALGGVYKLTAVRAGPDGEWAGRVKLSEQAEKVSAPGLQQVRRFRDDGRFAADMIFDAAHPPPAGAVTMVDPLDPTRRRTFPADADCEDLLVPVFRGGRRVRQPEALEAVRRRVGEQTDALHPGIRRFMNPHEYPVGLEEGLHERKARMVMEAREGERSAGPTGREGDR